MIRQIVDLEEFYTKYISKKIPISFEDVGLNEESKSLENDEESETGELNEDIEKELKKTLESFSATFNK